MLKPEGLATVLANNPSTPTVATIGSGYLKRRPLSRASLVSIRDHFCASFRKDDDDSRDTRATRASTTRPIIPSFNHDSNLDDTPDTTITPSTSTEHDTLEHRDSFIREYNRLARKHGVRPLIEDKHDELGNSLNLEENRAHRKSWLPRSLFGQSWQNRKPSSESREYKMHHEKRSLSELGLNLKTCRKDTLKDQNLDELVRLCGRSILYLPEEYAPGSLSLPTCLRAPAQYLVSHADEKGLFRITGSLKAVGLLYDFYACDDKDAAVSETTRHPSLPSHIGYEVHDIATLFKRILSGLPGGILGSLSLFDSLVAIHSQLHEGHDPNQIAQCKIKARLIALAVGSVRSQFRRELVCAVFGLLSLLGRVAETPTEEGADHSHNQSEMMGYEALGIVFGPLLVGDLLNTYTMKLADPGSGLVLYPATPPRSRREKMKKSRPEPCPGLTVDKIHVANNIAEMLISNWKEAVKHMKSLQILKPDHEREPFWGTPTRKLRPSSSMDLDLRKHPTWEIQGTAIKLSDSRASPLPPSPTPSYGRCTCITPTTSRNSSSSSRPSSSQRIGIKCSFSTLSPTVEEPGDASESRHPATRRTRPSRKHAMKFKRWSTVSLGSIQERSTHPALRRSPSKLPRPKSKNKLGNPPSKPTGSWDPPSNEQRKESDQSVDMDPPGTCSLRHRKEAMRLEDNEHVESAVEMSETTTVGDFNGCEETREPSQESAKSAPLLGQADDAPRKVTGLTRGPGSVKKLAAIFEKASEEPPKPLRNARSQGDLTSYTANPPPSASVTTTPHTAAAISTPTNKTYQVQGEMTTPTPGISPSLCLARGEPRFPPNVNTILQCQTDPPIARHVRVSRPLSMPPSPMQLSGFELPPVTPSINSTLHVQVRNLQKELEKKEEEVRGLRGRVQALEEEGAGGNGGILAERVREMEREVRIWRARAEGAEREVFVLRGWVGRVREASGCGIGKVDGVAQVGGKEMGAMGSGIVGGEEEYRGDALYLGRIRGVLREMDGAMEVVRRQGSDHSTEMGTGTESSVSVSASASAGSRSRMDSGEWGSEYSSETVVISRGFSGSALGQWIRGDEELMPVEEMGAIVEV